MKTVSKILTILFLTVFIAASSSYALIYNNNFTLQGVLDDITTAPVPGDSSVDVTTDYLNDSIDSYWSITGTGGSLSTMIIEVATFAPNNIFGVYSGDKYVPLFVGGNVAGDQTALSIANDGSVFVKFTDTGIDFTGDSFGYYLDSTYYANGGLFHSDSSLNDPDGKDHMVAYQGTNTDTVAIDPWKDGLWTNNEYILAFEDLKDSAADWDYTDMVVMVESVLPVPEPTTILLSGLGLLGIGAYLRRRQSKKA
jgi:hypothetical protein